MTRDRERERKRCKREVPSANKNVKTERRRKEIKESGRR